MKDLIFKKSVAFTKDIGYASIFAVTALPGTNIYIPWQVPSFVRDDHSRFLTFLEAYYAWMEKPGNIQHIARRIKYYQDVDYVPSKHFNKFHNEFLVNLPKNLATNRRTLLKYIRQFYRAKGTEKSFRLFFRILYDTPVDFYYPRTDILRVSDGKWIVDKAIRVVPLSQGKIKTSDFSNKTFTTSINGAQAYVNRARLIQWKCMFGLELLLNHSSISGELKPGDTITTSDGYSAVVLYVPQSASVYVNPHNKKDVRSGADYKKGDEFNIVDADGIHKGGKLRVLSVVDGAVKTVEIVEFGMGYGDVSYTFSLSQQNAVSGTVRTSTQDAQIQITTGGLFQYPGYQANTDGNLSSSKRIHDGEYYQQFSYVLYSTLANSDYDYALKKLIHPVGLKKFGVVRNETSVSAAITPRRTYLNIVTEDVVVPVHPQLKQSAVILENESLTDPKSLPVGASYQSIYREKFKYEPYENMENTMSGNNTGYWAGSNGVLANTPIGLFDDLGITPNDIEVSTPTKRINIQPDSEVICKQTDSQDG